MWGQIFLVFRSLAAFGTNDYEQLLGFRFKQAGCWVADSSRVLFRNRLVSCATHRDCERRIGDLTPQRMEGACIAIRKTRCLVLNVANRISILDLKSDALAISQTAWTKFVAARLQGMYEVGIEQTSQPQMRKPFEALLGGIS
jgi:hypothetical protein